MQKYNHHYYNCLRFPGALEVKSLPKDAGDSRDTGSIPDPKDPSEQEMETYSSILA